MSRIVLVLAVAMLFSGCIDLYLDVVRHADGSYTVRKMPVIGFSLLDQLSEFGKIGGDSTPMTRQQMLDSMMHELSWEHAAVLAMPGVLSYDLRDSIHDSSAYIITEAHIKDASTLAAVTNKMLESMDGKDHPADANKSHLELQLSHTKAGTQIGFRFLSTKEDIPSKEDMKMVEQIFGGHYFHVRVFSPDLLKPQDKDITSIPGGAEWKVALTKVADMSAAKKKNVRFVLQDK